MPYIHHPRVKNERIIIEDGKVVLNADTEVALSCLDATVRLLTQDPEALLCTYPSCRCQEVRRLVRKQGLTPRPLW